MTTGNLAWMEPVELFASSIYPSNSNVKPVAPDKEERMRFGWWYVEGSLSLQDIHLRGMPCFGVVEAWVWVSIMIMINLDSARPAAVILLFSSSFSSSLWSWIHMQRFQVLIMIDMFERKNGEEKGNEDGDI